MNLHSNGTVSRFAAYPRLLNLKIQLLGIGNQNGICFCISIDSVIVGIRYCIAIRRIFFLDAILIQRSCYIRLRQITPGIFPLVFIGKYMRIDWRCLPCRSVFQLSVQCNRNTNVCCICSIYPFLFDGNRGFFNGFGIGDGHCSCTVCRLSISSIRCDPSIQCTFSHVVHIGIAVAVRLWKICQTQVPVWCCENCCFHKRILTDIHRAIFQIEVRRQTCQILRQIRCCGRTATRGARRTGVVLVNCTIKRLCNVCISIRIGMNAVCRHGIFLKGAINIHILNLERSVCCCHVGYNAGNHFIEAFYMRSILCIITLDDIVDCIFPALRIGKARFIKAAGIVPKPSSNISPISITIYKINRRNAANQQNCIGICSMQIADQCAQIAFRLPSRYQLP